MLKRSVLLILLISTILILLAFVIQFTINPTYLTSRQFIRQYQVSVALVIFTGVATPIVKIINAIRLKRANYNIIGKIWIPLIYAFAAAAVFILLSYLAYFMLNRYIMDSKFWMIVPMTTTGTQVTKMNNDITSHLVVYDPIFRGWCFL